MDYLQSNQIMEECPSVFTTQQSEHLSKVYNHISTASVVDILKKRNWMPTHAIQVRNRKGNEHTAPFKKHILRFRNPNKMFSNTEMSSDTCPEIVVTNSHDGRSAFKFHIGLFRLVCSNGLVIADKTFGKHTIIHKGLQETDIIETVDKITSNIPSLFDKVKEMMSVEMSPEERVKFGIEAVNKRWNDGRIVDIEQLLKVNRSADKGNDLWTVFNRVQEKLINGGLNTSRKDGDKIIYNKSRKVTSIDENLRINKMLWELSESHL